MKENNIDKKTTLKSIVLYCYTKLFNLYNSNNKYLIKHFINSIKLWKQTIENSLNIQQINIYNNMTQFLPFEKHMDDYEYKINLYNIYKQISIHNNYLAQLYIIIVQMIYTQHDNYSFYSDKKNMEILGILYDRLDFNNPMTLQFIVNIIEVITPWTYIY